MAEWRGAALWALGAVAVSLVAAVTLVWLGVNTLAADFAAFCVGILYAAFVRLDRIMRK